MDHTLNYSYELQWTETYQDHQAQTIVNGGGVGTAGSGGAHHQQEEKAVVAPLPHPANHLVPRYYDPNEYPPGYRFCPDDRELVFEYLLKFLYNIGPDPWKKQHPIPTVDVYALSPDKITRNFPLTAVDNNDEWYFFTPVNKRYPGGIRPRRECADRSGFWKPTGKDKQIELIRDRFVVLKKSLEFFWGKADRSQKTDWKMHEYKMKTNDDQVMADSSSNKNAPKPKLLPALCRIYVNTRKKNKKKVDVEEEEQQQQPPPPAEVMNLGSKQAQQEVVTNAIDTIPGASDVLIEGGESIGVVNVDQQTISEIGDNSAADQSMADGFVDYHAAASQCPPSFNYQVTLNQQHPSFVGSGSNTGYPVAVGASSSHDRPTE